MMSVTAKRLPTATFIRRMFVRICAAGAITRCSMAWQIRRGCLLRSLLAGALLLAACAGPTIQQRDIAARSIVPASPDEANSLAGKALQAWAEHGDPAQAFTLISRAVALSGQRSDLLWLQIRLCAAAPGCDPAPFEARLRSFDPTNGIAWLGALDRAVGRGDDKAIAALLEAMSHARGFDLYWTGLVRRLTLALHAAHSASAGADDKTLTNTLDDITGWLSRLDMPAFRPLMSACDPFHVHAAGRQARCISIAAAMQASDTALAEGLGLGLAQRLAAAGSPQAARLEQRIATLRYRGQSAASIIEGQNDREGFSAEVLALMKILNREQDVTLAILRWAGHPLDPDG